MPMTKAERERQHQARLQRINQVQVVCGRGDRARLDHERTLLERARMMQEEICSHEAAERGLAAFERLLRMAEERASPHAQGIMVFLDAVWNDKPLPLTVLRVPDASIGDEMLAVLDAYRYARLSLPNEIEGGARRVVKVLAARRPETA
jgi:hypothetical protein